MFVSKKHISLFFLVIFTCIKLAGLHEFMHSDSEKHHDCDICEFVITTNTTPFLATENFDFELQIALNFEDEIFYEYKSQFVQSKITSILFGRPPPTL